MRPTEVKFRGFLPAHEARLRSLVERGEWKAAMSASGMIRDAQTRDPSPARIPEQTVVNQLRRFNERRVRRRIAKGVRDAVGEGGERGVYIHFTTGVCENIKRHIPDLRAFPNAYCANCPGATLYINSGVDRTLKKMIESWIEEGEKAQPDRQDAEATS